MAVVAIMISFTSSVPIPPNTNTNTNAHINHYCNFVPRAWCQPQRIPKQPSPVKKRDAHDDRHNIKGSDPTYKFPIGEPCIIKSRTGPGSDDNNGDLSQRGWCPPQMLDPVDPPCTIMPCINT
ncbi:hypothetical protein EC957_000361 [Mortierella hygrophila]|uniref:Uncharacterized protein n=1 Tax=Mortierella hygrophila TaxID=979708 RepID=A0A9P6F6Y9_9FUNG|nr:hypothetical protein EC957_000361 [Mortierella hygrophila]